jgi:NAD(P)-dependent dehydrogenase (short-subunit alcohol dehydrogenase family)
MVSQSATDATNLPGVRWAAFAEANPDVLTKAANAMPVPLIGASDISNAVAWLCSDETRYITGICLPVDAGFLVR